MSGSVLPRDGAASPDVSVIIVGHNSEHLLPRTLTALQAGCGRLRVQVIVVDNASRDRSAELLKRDFPNVELIENATNLGFGRANNQAMSRTRGRYILLLNPDAFVSADTLSKTVGFMDAHPRSGVLGVKLLDENGYLQPSAFRFPTPWNLFLNASRLDSLFGRSSLAMQDDGGAHPCDWVRGCFYLIRREVIETSGLFDPRYFLYYEEVDHCHSLRGTAWEVTYYPGTAVTHMGGESAKRDGGVLDGSGQISALHAESELLYFRKHHGLTGVLMSVFLTSLVDLSRALKRLVVLRDPRRALAALGHIRLVLTLLAETRMGSRAVH
jgi:N-acetylglucosaminyl-diphospho-decaprenol L-rhamnosyltransferase